MTALDIRAPEFHANPYPIFRRLRAEAPVSRIEPEGLWAISRYQDVTAVLKDPRTFSSAGIAPESKRGADLLFNSRGMVDADPPDHTRLRGLLSGVFTPRAVTSLEPKIRKIAQTLLAQARHATAFDLVSSLAKPLPMLVLAELLGIHQERITDFSRWARTLVTWRNIEKIADASVRHARQQAVESDIQSMLSYFTEVIAEKEARPCDDLISALVQASRAEDGAGVTSEEILGSIRLLLVAGTETTTHLIGNTTLALLNHPDVWEKVSRDPTLVPALIEETLRFDGPVLSLIRRATVRTEIAGTTLEAGDFVLPLLGSANHDEAKFEDSERFSLERRGAGHVAFGSGIHFCLGSPLARLQARVVFEELVRAYDGLERLSVEPPEYIASFFFRGLKSLEVQLT